MQTHSHESLMGGNYEFNVESKVQTLMYKSHGGISDMLE